MKSKLPLIIKLILTTIGGVFLVWCAGFWDEVHGGLLVWVITLITSLIILRLAHQRRDKQISLGHFYRDFIISLFSFALFWGLIEAIWLKINNEAEIVFEVIVITILWVPLLAFWSASWFVLLRFGKFGKE